MLLDSKKNVCMYAWMYVCIIVTKCYLVIYKKIKEKQVGRFQLKDVLVLKNRLNKNLFTFVFTSHCIALVTCISLYFSFFTCYSP